MRYSKLFLPTLKEAPAEAEIVSHRLMLRAGMIRRLSSGLYSYLPIGLRSLMKVEKIVREEMGRAGAQEVLLPMVQPAELWQESGRWDRYGKELLRLKDRHGRDYCLGPTHEEVITDLVRREVRSYKDLPLNLYQIHTKFRDEIRPRFGLMRSREFVMKDAYSFDVDDEALEITYQAMYGAYCRIFERCGLDFRPVEADTGSIGGHASHEFMVLAETGEDQIACCTQCSYAANVELAPALGLTAYSCADEEDMRRVHTPGKRSVEEVIAFLNVSPSSLVKTLVFICKNGPIVALVRGDHSINEVKLKRLVGIEDVALADSATVVSATGCEPGFAGPVGLAGRTRIIADNALKTLKNFVVGANEPDWHLLGVNWGRDLPWPEFADIRFITPDDPCPRCGGRVELKRGIEVGHVFKLGTKYSEALHAVYIDDSGKERPIVMGCYGIGIGRTVAAAVEQNHDSLGIVFPAPIAPFDCVISIVDMTDDAMSFVGERICSELEAKGVDCLLDDRRERPGVKFKDADLIGIPIRVTVGRRLREDGRVEIKVRASGESVFLSVDDAADEVFKMLKDICSSRRVCSFK
ncbi:proline--tRNA ligase [Dissulfurimicrobium hydrothermale]|uniref:proline--tRNA ligase n=1 Tax=Dissulfurimicrobium hydrothermale TaxID=1750598 RepID=UPI001EDAED95|nr:proline--tRNA ligase [Dissulfurimicrobium hydrothermale]UKL14658.1 proline--tRNA ligase [Dissulfurimicrobium hydrothermale]